MEQLTVEELCQKVVDAIANASNLKKFYIGRTDSNLKQREDDHEGKMDLPYIKRIATGEESLMFELENYISTDYNGNCY